MKPEKSGLKGRMQDFAFEVVKKAPKNEGSIPPNKKEPNKAPPWRSE